MICCEEKQTTSLRFFLEKDGRVVGSIFLYILKNNLHDEPYGYMEDLVVDEAHRGKGLGTELITAVIDEAKRRGCYKLVGTSRHTRPGVHAWYEKLGFKNYGVEFRMDL